ncbi:hypothetical protein IFM61392_10342 [Aspergillus lentulus]|nr:hypothetical protein IFM61392_10342 [Aspergillus lentulus]
MKGERRIRIKDLLNPAFPEAGKTVESKNPAEATRVELVNDYRTLLVHVMELIGSTPTNEIGQSSYETILQCHSAAQRLLTGTYDLPEIPSPEGKLHREDAETMALRDIILDASARRHQAHKIYLKVAAVKRWVKRFENLKSHSMAHAPIDRLRQMDIMLCKELADVTDQTVASNLYEADVRAGYWREDDPTLTSVLARIRRADWGRA